MHPLADAWVYDHFSQYRPEVSAGVVASSRVVYESDLISGTGVS